MAPNADRKVRQARPNPHLRAREFHSTVCFRVRRCENSRFITKVKEEALERLFAPTCLNLPNEVRPVTEWVSQDIYMVRLVCFA